MPPSENQEKWQNSENEGLLKVNKRLLVNKMVKIKTCKQTCSHSVTFPSVDTGKQRGGTGPYCAHTPSCTHAWHAWRWRDNDRAKAGTWKWLFRVFLRNLIRVCEVSNSFFSLKKLWEDLNLLRHHQSFHFSFAVTLQTLACYVYPAVYRFFECHLLCFYVCFVPSLTHET